MNTTQVLLLNLKMNRLKSSTDGHHYCSIILLGDHFSGLKKSAAFGGGPSFWWVIILVVFDCTCSVRRELHSSIPIIRPTVSVTNYC